MKMRDVLGARPVPPAYVPRVDAPPPPPPVIVPREPVPFHEDGRTFDTEAMSWLRQKLTTGPQRLGELMREWCEPVRGHSSQDINARIDLLNEARWALEIHPYINEVDDRFWWRLERETWQ